MVEYEKDYFVGGDFDNYDNCKGVIEYQAEMFKRVFEPTSFFSAGCAYGHDVNYMKEFMPASGCDISEWAVSKNPNIFRCKVEDLAVNNPFDLVSCTEVMEHIDEELTDKVLDNLYRMTGRYLVLVIDFDRKDMEAHTNVHPREWWEQKLSRFERDIEKERLLDEDPESNKMEWSGRYFVIKKGVR